jgi:hypothetical protein
MYGRKMNLKVKVHGDAVIVMLESLIAFVDEVK